MIDVTEQVNSTSRQLGSRTLEAGEARVLTISRTYDTSVDDVWDACTNPERLPRWFLPVSGELEVGGRYQLEGNAGGTVERCDPPTSFAATWEFGGKVSWIEVRLSAASGGGTRFQLEHLALLEDDDTLWATYGPGALGIGWDLALYGLALHLATGEAVDEKEYEAWTMSEEGHRFVTLANESWRAASIAFGTDPEEAKAAAERSTAFYTGTEAPAES
ncbi:Uncharacterized conserved protein YndB, AHSA1/START domain [Amycolatopsis arida]|uniref:Uncharacterized conserved protein YndB, AHSA1/START domain n=1 Tax=Amycolatopsis arida TaxID=587909 RepID=A0A1I5LL12_9PSEU|nr:SRPBCC family protein [Amycolatopsis arida]TDX93759.1 uncharacterized protein YndB with AHSA1/START domain [Amycolatopsis arida]SFO98008.1 Uncharacterized conserved protein YndB, AHSA1/START domain [Amycolatopsis arida]